MSGDLALGFFGGGEKISLVFPLKFSSKIFDRPFRQKILFLRPKISDDFFLVFSSF